VTDGGVARPLVAASQVRLDFRTDGTMGASAGCNSIGAMYELDGARLQVESGGMTAMGCDAQLHAQDEWLAAFLASGPAVAIAGERIALSSGGVVIQLLDESVANPDRPLAGTEWFVEGIRTGDAVASVPAGLTATIRLGDDGSATIDTGCNPGRTTAMIEGDQLRFEEVAMTKRACLDAASTDLERALLDVVGAPAVTWSITTDRLTLDAGGAGLDLRAG
jgi:heat shock protein HslJ